jgi:hypothetical protein
MRVEIDKIMHIDIDMDKNKEMEKELLRTNLNGYDFRTRAYYYNSNDDNNNNNNNNKKFITIINRINNNKFTDKISFFNDVGLVETVSDGIVIYMVWQKLLMVK